MSEMVFIFSWNNIPVIWRNFPVSLREAVSPMPLDSGRCNGCCSKATSGEAVAVIAAATAASSSRCKLSCIFASANYCGQSLDQNFVAARLGGTIQSESSTHQIFCNRRRSLEHRTETQILCLIVACSRAVE